MNSFDKETYVSDYNSARRKVAENTIDRLKYMEECGYFKPGYSYDDVLGLILSETSPEVYLTEEYVNNWKSKWKVDSNGNTQVVMIQSADTGAPGAASFGGSVGRSGEGAYIMPLEQYNDIISDPAMYDSNGNLDLIALGERLGGVKLGEQAVAIVQTVSIEDVTLPTGSLEGSFVGEYVPGGYTSAGHYEVSSGKRVLVGSNVEGFVPATNLFNTDGTLNQNISLELLTPSQREAYIKRAAQSKMNTIVNTINKAISNGNNPYTAKNINDLALAVAACEKNGVDIQLMWKNILIHGR